MNEQLAGMESFARVYMDDIIVFSSNVHEHMAHLRQVLARMQARQLAVKERKCEFMRHRLTFLGHVVSAGGVSPDPTKVEAIAQLAAPADVSQLRSFLGCCNFYERFIRGYARIASPLTDLLGSRVPWEWGPTQSTAFEVLRSALTSAPVLVIPDMRGDFTIDTDASAYGIGGSI